MSTVIDVSVEGEEAFEWEGSEEEIAHLLDELPKTARGRHVSPEQVAAASILHIHRQGRFMARDPIGQRGEMAHIVWAVLNAPMHEARVADLYAGEPH
jgi:hypothetical protein